MPRTSPLTFPWKFLLKIGACLVIGGLASLILFLTWKTVSGRRELAKVQNELQARGEKLSITELEPPPVPEERNFFADPLWEEFYPASVKAEKTPEARVSQDERQLDGLNQKISSPDYQKVAAEYPEFSPKGNVPAAMLKLAKQERTAEAGRQRRAAEFILAATAYATPLLDRVRTLAKRPEARFPQHYDAGANMNLDHISPLMWLSQLFGARACAHAMLGDRDAARADTLTALRLAEVSGEEPLLICHLVRLTNEEIALQAINTGLLARVWTEGDLLEFERLLQRLNPTSALQWALRGELGSFNRMVEILKENPENLRGFASQPLPGNDRQRFALLAAYLMVFGPGDQAFGNRIFQEWIEGVGQAPTQGLNARRVSDGEIMKEASAPMLLKAQKMLSLLMLPPPSGAATRSAFLQDQIALARIAGALERYRLKNGIYPDAPTALVPDFLPALPLDTVTLKPVLYRRNDQAGFLLWTVGWDEKDDAGKPYERKTQKGDWIWGEPMFEEK